MKLSESNITQSFPNAGVLNVFSLGAISLTWGHILGLVSLWLIPLTVIMYAIAYGSEIKPTIGFK